MTCGKCSAPDHCDYFGECLLRDDTPPALGWFFAALVGIIFWVLFTAAYLLVVF